MYQTAHVATHGSVLYHGLSHHIKLGVLTHTAEPCFRSTRGGRERLCRPGLTLCSCFVPGLFVAVARLYVSSQQAGGCFSACLMRLNIGPVTCCLKGSLRTPPQDHHLLPCGLFTACQRSSVFISSWCCLLSFDVKHHH